LKRLALLGAVREPVEMGIHRCSHLLSQSTQTAARKLEVLEREGYIERWKARGKSWLIITNKGKETLFKEYMDYKTIFSDKHKKKIVLSGRVVSGLGEGQYYTNLEGYRTQFKEKLGINPYPGTLNIKLDEKSLPLRSMFELGGIHIEGFKTEDRTFGEARCYPATIEGLRCGLVLPQRSHHGDDIIEVISPYYLREKLGLKDGSEVKVEVQLV